ncbi:hypothetical protein B0H14DRAFT_2601294 [Mycena olivaceomarginata]|nr:hypothetical protein B0H14DRAFT_2601294 [Mycena olivaceomarginata]
MSTPCALNQRRGLRDVFGRVDLEKRTSDRVPFHPVANVETTWVEYTRPTESMKLGQRSGLCQSALKGRMVFVGNRKVLMVTSGHGAEAVTTGKEHRVWVR